jgi:hypothetical protein
MSNPLYQVGNGCARNAFSLHANDTIMVPLLRAVRGRHSGERTSAAYACDAAAGNRAASVTECG